MNWDKKSIAAIFACIVLFTVYMSYLQRKYPEYYAGRGQENTETAPAPQASPGVDPAQPAAPATAVPALPTDAASPDAPPAIAQLSPEQLRFETKTRTFEFDQDTGSIKSIRLKDYKQDLGGQEFVELLDSPLILQATVQPTLRQAKRAYAATREGNKVSFTRREGTWDVTHIYSIPEDGYGLDYQTQFRNTSDQAQDLSGGVLLQETLKVPTSGGGFFSALVPTMPLQSFVYSIDGERDEKMMAGFCHDEEESSVILNNEKLDFLGIDKHYFLSFLWAKNQPMSYELHRTSPPTGEACSISLIAYQNFGSVGPGSSVDIKLDGYFGPKQINILTAHDPALENSLKLGWFSFFAKPLLVSLKGLYSIFHNYGIAIILITLVLKMLFYPLTRAAAISMKKMQKLQPEMTRIREKFKDDPQRQQRELMAFMGQHKVNPLKGCLPILPQIPVFIAFYNVLSQAIELRHAPFYGWLTDLASRDPYYITPVLLGIGMFLQQKLTPNPGMDKNQEKIMLMMPVIFTVMMLSLPAGMVLYMITNTVVSILQQQWLNRRLDKTLG